MTLVTWAQAQAFWRAEGYSTANVSRLMLAAFGAGYSPARLSRRAADHAMLTPGEARFVAGLRREEAPHPPRKRKPAMPTARRWPIGSVWLDAA